MDTQNSEPKSMSKPTMPFSSVEQEKEQENREEIPYLVPTEQEKSHAHRAVARAIDRGELVPSESCEQCHTIGFTHGHHYAGYGEDAILKVQWLCRSCHRKSHESQLTPELRIEHRKIRKSRAGSLITVNVRDVDEVYYERLRLEAFQRKCSMGQILSEALKAHFGL